MRAGGLFGLGCLLVAAALLAGGCGGGGGGGRRDKGAKNPPKAPPGFTATAGDSDAVLRWTNLLDATSYTIYWSTTAGVTVGTGTPVANARSPFLHSGLVNGTTYYYIVTASNDFGEGLPAPEQSATPSQQMAVLATHDDAAGGASDDQALAVAADASGRLVVCGQSINAAFDNDLAVWRYRDDGSLDTSFGTGGVFTHDDAGGFGPGSPDWGSDVVALPAGDIIVVGASAGTFGTNEFAVWKLTPGGALDLSFGSGDGHFTRFGGFGNDFGNALAVDAFGRIVATGTHRGSNGTLDMIIWRLEGDGTLDLAFGGQGFAISDDAAGGGWEIGNDIVMGPAGSIIVAGWAFDAAGKANMGLWRYNDFGQPDTSFGTSGFARGSIAQGTRQDAGFCVAIDSRNRILVGGNTENLSDLDAALWRFTAAGAPDLSFGGTGYVVHDSAAGGGGNDTVWDVSADAFNRPLLAGFSTNAALDLDMAFWRYDETGMLEISRVHDSAAGGFLDDEGSGIATTATGTYVVGSSHNGADLDVAIWRMY